MADMTTALYEVSMSGNNRTLRTANHTVVKPQLIVSNRKPASNSKGSAISTDRFSFGTVDAEGTPVDNRCSFEVIVKRPIIGLQADVDNALSLFREYVASDNFTRTVASQDYPA